MAYAPQSSGPWLKGLVASNQPLAQPKGSFPRGSNLVMMERGALTPCDGSGIINFYNGAVQNNRGRFSCLFLFLATGVSPYFLGCQKASDQPLGTVQNVATADGGAGGSLTPLATYDYIITAIDGVGGITMFSASASFTEGAASHKVVVTWDELPNAHAYVIWRAKTIDLPFYRPLVGVTAGGLSSLIPQSTSPTFTDDGSIPDPFAVSTSVVSVSSGAQTPGASTLAIFKFASTTGFFPGLQFDYVGGTDATYNGPQVVQAVTSGTTVLCSGGTNDGGNGTGGSISFSSLSSIGSDTTEQTVLIKFPTGPIPTSYTNANIVAKFPATPASLGAEPFGGSGGGGTTGSGSQGQFDSTPSGGIQGLVSMIPQMKQFTNRVILALGNGFAPQVYWDSTGTPVNPAPTGAIASVVTSGTLCTFTVSGSVTISGTDPTKNGFMPVGTNVILSGMSDASYDGVFIVTAITPGAGGTFSVVIPGNSGGATTGTFTVSTTPIISNFTPAYPIWAATTVVAVGDIYVPKTQPGAADIYITCIQAGTTGGSEPSWIAVAATGQVFPTKNIPDGSVLWQETGYLASPPPPGAGHIEIYAGSLWVLNTSPTNTADGLDGPTALRMSNTNNIFGWNPVNQAFLDKDDGAEGMGLGKFTITAQGIPPEGSLIAFKYRVPYQIIGVFGANNFAIQPVSSDMGCLAPRTIQFVAGYGLTRYTHLGYSVFDGWRDQVISEQIRPYLFPVNDFDTKDITVADANYIPLSWGAQTANPPMYCVVIPIGNSGGQLTRIMLYDLILKCWAAPVDLPFPIGCMSQVQPVTSNPLTVIGGFDDGCLQRWQAGDVDWYTGGGGAVLEVSWSVRTVTMASQNSSQRIWARKILIRGTGSNVDTDPAITINVQIRSSGVVQSSVNYKASNQGDFDIDAAIGLTGVRFDAILSGADHIEIDGWDWAIEPRPFGVPVAAV